MVKHELEYLRRAVYAEQMSDRPVPVFRANTKDDLHCFEACVAMILETTDPTKKYTLEELAKIAGKKPKGWTWPMRLATWLVDQGFEVVSEDGFDYEAFVRDGALYLERTFGNEVAKVQIKHADIEAERQAVPAFIDVIHPKKVIPTIERVRELIEAGYLVICNVNQRVMKKEPGYAGHAVVLYDFTDRGFYLHDPGLPAARAQHVPTKLFEDAWAFPNVDAKNILAIKYRKQKSVDLVS